MRLFKYLSPARVDVLQSNMFVFSKPSSFNDPFDCLPHYQDGVELNPLGSRTYFLKVEPHELLSANLYDEVLDHVKRSHAADPSFTLDAVVTFDSTILPESYGDMVRGYRSSSAPTIQDSVVALSLTEEENSLLMWAHYAKDHTGFVIGLCSEHSYFNSAGVNPSNPGYLNRVKYSGDRPSGIVGTMSAEKTYLTKGVEWSYEREWRILQRAYNATHVKKVESGEIHLFKYPSDAVVQVVIGAKAGQETKETIKSILSDKLVWPNVTLYQAVVDSRHYRLNYEKV